MRFSLLILDIADADICNVQLQCLGSCKEDLPKHLGETVLLNIAKRPILVDVCRQETNELVPWEHYSREIKEL